MEKTNKSLKEWNAIIEALGQGKQSILIRKYPTNVPGFLLFPSVSYVLKKNCLENFKVEYQPFVNENALPNKKEDKTEIKYYAKVEKVVEKSSTQLSRLNKLHIWNKDHIKNYFGNKKGFVWILRVYKIANPYMAEINRGRTYAHLKNEIDLSNAKAVLDEKEFSEVLKVI